MPSASAASRDALDRLRSSSQPISGFSGLPKLRQSVSASGSPPAQATLQRGAEHGERPPAPRVALAGRRPCRARPRAPRSDGPQPQHGRVEPGPAHRARADELVVLLEIHALRREVRVGARPCGSRRAGSSVRRLALDLVARALVREEPGRDRADDLAVEERAQLAGVGDLADHGVHAAPTARRRACTALEQLGPHDGDHPLLRLGDHDLPRLDARLAQRHAVEVDVDAGAVARHLGERGGEPGGAAVLQRLDEPALDELERRLDQLLAGERVADLHGRPLVVRVLAELLAREHGRAADPVAAGRRAVEDDARCPRSARLRARAPARSGAGRRTSR